MRLNLVLLFLLICNISVAQPDTVQQRVFLVGDAGEIINGRIPVVDWLKKNINWNDTINTAVFLGDNIYQVGLPLAGAPGYEQAKRVIDYQIGLVEGKKAKAYIIPGNHDWMNGAPGGAAQAINQNNYINGRGLPNVFAIPLEGCPGPVMTEVDDKLLFVFGDSQWFLHLHDKPGPGSSCAAKTIEEFVTELNEIIATHPNQLLIFAVHHPFYTYGPHGGDYTWKDHVFPFLALSKNLYIPLPVIGSAYPIARGYFGNIQDIYHPLYRNMINEIEATLKKHPNPIHVSGHEHSLQLNVKDSIPYVVSGSGSRISRLRKGTYGVYSHIQLGFSMIEIMKSGTVSIKFYDVQSKDLSTPLYTYQSKSIVPVVPVSTQDTNSYNIPDRLTVIPDERLKAGLLKRILVGKNYRDDWTSPISLPVLDLGKEAGGLKAVKQRGGGQLRALMLEDKNKKQWSLRSVERFPQHVIPTDLRTPINPDLHEDANSASYPFASLIVAELNKAVRIPSARQKLVYVPDDPRLTRFRNDFKNRIAILEETVPPGVKSVISTNDLMLNIQNEPNSRIDQKRVLRARLMDNFVMNFNRNENQWMWAVRDSSASTIYYPIPLHSSQAFWVSHGIIPKLSQRILAIPEIQGFDDDADNITAFNRAAYNFDEQFLNTLSQPEWETEIDTFLSRMSDSAIVKAVTSQPIPSNSENDAFIIRTLQKRKESFKEEMLEYYRFLSKQVIITGTKGREVYHIVNNQDGSVMIEAFGSDKAKGAFIKRYNRVFDPKVTKEIRIYAQEGNDSFVVSGNSPKILVRLIGGPGKDHFISNGTNRDVVVYDADFEDNIVAGEQGFDLLISSDPRVNSYDRYHIRRDYMSPGLSLAYNVDDGVLVGGELEMFRYKFRKSPYNARHLIQAQYATGTQSLFLKYETDLVDVINETDIVIRADVRAPNHVTNYFGLGNNTVYDQSKPGGIQYYRVNYDVGRVAVMVRKNLQSWMNADIGPAFQFYKIERPANNTDRLSEQTLNNEEMFRPRYLGGLDAQLSVNSKNNDVLPSRGALLRMCARHMIGLNQYTGTVSQLGLDLSFFMSINPNTRTVLGTRFGFGHNIGSFEFPLAQYLGGTENLRGYRKDRFAGKSMMFNNTELRVRLRQFKTYLFPGSYGFLLFHDIGRVWMKGETSTRWHNGYGGGLWISPVHRFVLTATAAYSRDRELLPAVGFGFQF